MSTTELNKIEPSSRSVVAVTTSVKGQVLTAAVLDTQFEPMLALADEQFLYALEFIRERSLPEALKRLEQKHQCTVVEGTTPPIDSIKKELDQYFEGKLKQFKTPIHPIGTPFQQKVWQALQTIPYGETRSYAQTATQIGKPTAYRAAASANGANPLTIIIPCHRVINSDGKLGGYSAGLPRKQWLLDHEKEDFML